MSKLTRKTSPFSRSYTSRQFHIAMHPTMAMGSPSLQSPLMLKVMILLIISSPDDGDKMSSSSLWRSATCMQYQ